MPQRNEVGDAFAAALRRMLKDRTIATAAAQLGVSRQAFHAYLNGKLPRRKTLNRAMFLWNLKLGLGKNFFDKGAFGTEEAMENEASRATTAQMAFWETVNTIEEKDLHVTMKRVGKVLQFKVEIKVPA